MTTLVFNYQSQPKMFYCHVCFCNLIMSTCLIYQASMRSVVFTTLLFPGLNVYCGDMGIECLRGALRVHLKLHTLLSNS